jgi:hypothetical protein
VYVSGCDDDLVPSCHGRDVTTAASATRTQPSAFVPRRTVPPADRREGRTVPDVRLLVLPFRGPDLPSVPTMTMVGRGRGKWRLRLNRVPALL